MLPHFSNVFHGPFHHREEAFVIGVIHLMHGELKVVGRIKRDLKPFAVSFCSFLSHHPKWSLRISKGISYSISNHNFLDDGNTCLNSTWLCNVIILNKSAQVLELQAGSCWFVGFSCVSATCVWLSSRRWVLLWVQVSVLSRGLTEGFHCFQVLH